MAHVLHLRMFDFILREDLLFKFSPLSWKQNKTINILHDFTDKVIRERREEVLKNNLPVLQVTDDNDVGLKNRHAFLDILLQATIDGKPLTNLEIREEVDTFMFEVILFYFFLMYLIINYIIGS